MNRISACLPAILNEAFRGFIQFLKTNGKIIPLNMSERLFPNPYLLTIHEHLPISFNTVQPVYFKGFGN